LDSPPLLSCTILVGTANELVAPVHDRMAVVFGERRARVT
jgi:putative SOS response-associated peptidase YedK